MAPFMTTEALYPESYRVRLTREQFKYLRENKKRRKQSISAILRDLIDRERHRETSNPQTQKEGDYAG